MTEDVDRICRVCGRHLLQHLDPARNPRAGGTVDERMQAIEHQIAHVHDVGLLEGNHAVAAGVTGAVIPGHHRLVADRRPPFIGESLVRIGLRVLVPRLLGRPPLPRRAVLVGDDGADHRPKRLVAADMVTVVVRVDQQVDRTRRPLPDPVDARRRGRGVLAVDDQDAVRVHEPADRASLPVEDAHATPQVLERRGEPLPAGERQILERGPHDCHARGCEKLASVHDSILPFVADCVDFPRAGVTHRKRRRP